MFCLNFDLLDEFLHVFVPISGLSASRDGRMIKSFEFPHVLCMSSLTALSTQNLFLGSNIGRLPPNLWRDKQHGYSAEMDAPMKALLVNAPSERRCEKPSPSHCSRRNSSQMKARPMLVRIHDFS